MKYIRLIALPVLISLAACPPPESIMSDEELETAAASGNEAASRELAERKAVAALPPLPESPDGEDAFRDTLAAGDDNMLERLNTIGNPWARWYAAEEIFRTNSNSEALERARNYMIAATDGGVLEARVFVLLAHKNGLHGYKQDDAYVRTHLLPLRQDLAAEIKLGRSDYIPLVKSLPDAK